MQIVRPGPVFTRSVLRALVLIVALSTACHGWHVESATPQAVIATHHPSTLRITLDAGIEHVVQDPVIKGDTLVGFNPHANVQTVRIALTDVRLVSTRRFSSTKTLGLGLATGALALMGYVILAIRSLGD